MKTLRILPMLKEDSQKIIDAINRSIEILKKIDDKKR